MNEIFDAVSARIKAPYFGYTLLAFVAWNWRGLFLLFATSGSPEDRLMLFDAQTSFLSLVVFPLLVGCFAAVSAPWLRFVFGIASRRPFELIDNIGMEAEHKKMIKKTQLERSRADFFAGKESELIERAKRDEEVLEISNEQVKEQLKRELDALREQRHRMSENSGNADGKPDLSDAEVEILKAAAKSKSGNISRNEYVNGRNIKAGDNTFGVEGSRDFLKYDAALQSLRAKSLVQAVGIKGQLFELTHKGWEIADQL